MAYYLVDEGFVWTCVIIGMTLGFLVLGVLAWFLMQTYQKKIREYYIECPDEDKAHIMNHIELLRDTWFYLALKTNTIYAKRGYNHVLDLINTLKKKKIET
jgi:hypothetical protein